MTKEEFEKEVEEYCMHQSLLEDVRDNICKAFEDGAEFVYNKAKEIIKDYMTIAKGSHATVCGVSEENRTINVLKLNKEAEQFLKE